MKSSPQTVPHREVAMAFGVRAQHSNISHRSQRSVPEEFSEEFSAPLELSQPLSGLVDGSYFFLSHPPQQVP